MEHILTANKTLHHKLDKVNVKLHSPLSMTYALMMTYLGSSGESKKIFEKCFGFKQVPTESRLIDDLCKLKNTMEATKKSVCKLSNGIFINKRPIKKSYEEKMSSLDIDAKTVDFSDSRTKDNINNWIANKTNGLITNVLDEISEAAMLIIVNCLYFKGDWIYPFDVEYTNEHGLFNNKKATMMSEISGNDYKYFVNDKQEIVELSYENGYSMGIILPKKNGTSYYDLETDVEQYFDKMTYKTVFITIPKFEQRIKISYSGYAKELDIEELFDHIDITNLIDSSNDIAITDIIQEVVVKVNEDGTEAAATTVIELEETGCEDFDEVRRISFVADHSFVYYIKHNATNIVMFKGTLTEV